MIRKLSNISLACFAIAIFGCNAKTTQTATQSEGETTGADVIPDDAKAFAIAAKEALFKKLSGRLMEVMQAEGPVKAIKVCSTEANEIAQTVGEEQGVKIGRTSLKLRNPKNQPPAWAKELFTGQPHEPQFVHVDGETVGALLPIKLQAKCLMCHGPVDSLVPGVPEQLSKLYPDDQATGFREGDLRGWFWVEVPADSSVGEAVVEDDDQHALIQYGKMREVIGQKKHHGRVQLTELAEKKNVYAVGAIEGLTGEVTIVDSQVVATKVDDANELSPVVDPKVQATLLVGRSVSSWREFSVDADIAAEDFDDCLAKIAEENSVDLSEPTVFMIEGEFSECCLHVINGACPVHAELHGEELAEGERPYKTTLPTIRGTLVGVYARDAVGVITHPGTKTHRHIVFTRPGAPEQLTAHVESGGILQGSILRLPSPPTSH